MQQPLSIRTMWKGFNLLALERMLNNYISVMHMAEKRMLKYMFFVLGG